MADADAVTFPETITCSRCGEEKPGLGGAPMKGPVGTLIGQNVCEECWKAWVGQQVMFINHYGLDTMNPAHKEQLQNAMKEFLGLADKPVPQE